ncbi:ABC transporter permease [Streptomyces subrutilus]|uniref:ABC transporter permease n=1 Tax=Streptomyces subrutilus TaxID=36818 RepID=UPI002E151A73|nr:ABC transporter permease [Streptomyces subrutilus]
MPDLTKTETATAEETSAPVAPVEAQKPEKARSLWGDAWADLRRNPYFIASSVLIFFLLLIAVVPSLFTSADPTKGDLVNHFLQKPDLASVGKPGWLGWDGQGRSVYARLIYGTRASLIVAVCVTLIVTIVGGLTGMIAGYFGGMTDAVISRLTDVFFGVPFLLGAMVVLQAFTNRTVWTVVFALAFLGWTQITRVMRGAVITVKQADYVHAAKALGAGTPRIMLRHILPNAMAPVIVVSTIALGGYIAAEATLSYLGLGLASPSISWGVDISAGSDQIRVAQHILIYPSIMLSITVLAFIMLGEAVRNALDPKLR